MSPVRPLHHVLLAPATALLSHVVADHDCDPRAAHDVLDAAASQIGGFDLDGYRSVLDIDARLETHLARAWADTLLDLIESSSVPRRLAIASLAQPEVSDTRRRSTGVYYTDFRLARYLARRTAQLAATSLTPSTTAIDTAAGTGVLLVALAEEVGRNDAGALRDLVADGLSAVDVDPECRRGTVTALASLTADLAAISRMANRVQTADSLVADPELWSRLGEGGRFDAVIGNPPWERLRVTRHEALVAGGSPRHYGADYGGADYGGADYGGAGYEADTRHGHVSSGEVDRLRRYVADLASRYPVLGNREIDLCYAFLALGWSLVRPGGSLGMLLPAGLIRAQGTQLLREHLLTTASEIDLTVLHNRSRFFEIDTRFKFIAMCAQVAGFRTSAAVLALRHSAGNAHGVPEQAPLRIKFGDLAAARRDLTVPEVTGRREWRLFQHMTVRGIRPRDPDSPWAMQITREVDMTRARHLFSRTGTDGHVPVVEGRMVQQYRSRAKTYLTGTGRAAIWRPVELGAAGLVRPQFFVDPGRLPGAARERISRARVGFCDIVGQTNERTFQAAVIESGNICGNKVPTIDFCVVHDGVARQREMLFLAAANSLIVDWFIRRVVTTSLNFFILLDLPLPPLDPGSPAGRRLVALTERLVAAETTAQTTAQEISRYRAEVDLTICQAYGIDLADLPMILADFPLLDRRQPPLPGEAKSTVTSDLLAGLGGDRLARERYEAAAGIGAQAYVPEEFAQVGTGRFDPSSGQSAAVSYRA